jgi:aminopeptidase-like protein
LTVPPGWNIRDADQESERHCIVDFQRSNLHVVSYSVPWFEEVALSS